MVSLPGRGTMQFVSPEVVGRVDDGEIQRSGEYDGKAVDMFAVGQVLYTMIYGKYPYRPSAGENKWIGGVGPNTEPSQYKQVAQVGALRPWPASEHAGASKELHCIFRNLLQGYGQPAVFLKGKFVAKMELKGKLSALDDEEAELLRRLASSPPTPEEEAAVRARLEAIAAEKAAVQAQLLENKLKAGPAAKMDAVQPDGSKDDDWEFESSTDDVSNAALFASNRLTARELYKFLKMQYPQIVGPLPNDVKVELPQSTEFDTAATTLQATTRGWQVRKRAADAEKLRILQDKEAKDAEEQRLRELQQQRAADVETITLFGAPSHYKIKYKGTTYDVDWNREGVTKRVNEERLAGLGIYNGKVKVLEGEGNAVEDLQHFTRLYHTWVPPTDEETLKSLLKEIRAAEAAQAAAEAEAAQASAEAPAQAPVPAPDVAPAMASAPAPDVAQVPAPDVELELEPEPPDVAPGEL